MAVTLTTGPFMVPNQDHFPMDFLNLILKNPTKKELTVTVFFERCQHVIYPATSPEVTEPPEVVTLPPQTCTNLQRVLVFPDRAQTIFRVTVTGDIEQDGGKIELELFSGFFASTGLLLDADPSVLFRHKDFMRVEQPPSTS